MPATSRSRRAVVIAGIACASLVAAATPALSAQTLVRDRQGRPITFDVRTSGVDVAGYGRIMRNAIHGDEIRTVRIRIVARSRIAALCGEADAQACYGGTRGGGEIIVPKMPASQVASVLLHEYGHHIDRSRSNGSLQEPNGTPRWWAARRMGQRLAAGQVAFDYSLGWDRAIGEIFAEDYVQLQMRTSDAISWLGPPGSAVLKALRRDLGVTATTTPTDPGTGTTTPADPGAGTPDPGATGPGVDPGSGVPADPGTTTPGAGNGLQWVEQGQVGDGQAVSVPFGLLGPGRSVTVEAVGQRFDGDVLPLTVSVTCDGVQVAATQGGADGSPVVVSRAGLGPAQCTADVDSADGTPGAASVRITLTLPQPGPHSFRPRPGGRPPASPTNGGPLRWQHSGTSACSPSWRRPASRPWPAAPPSRPAAAAGRTRRPTWPARSRSRASR